MSNKEIEFDDYPDEVFASKKAFFKRFRILEGEERAEHKRRIAKALGGEKKSRVTIYFDNRVIDRFKEMAEERNVGYQTLINDALLSVVESMDEKSTRIDLKEDILKDRKFLKKLKAALSF